ncbi:hypothetical protein JCM10213v2_002127 [Rhodosporidiobolus nylandii]
MMRRSGPPTPLQTPSILTSLSPPPEGAPLWALLKKTFRGSKREGRLLRRLLFGFMGHGTAINSLKLPGPDTTFDHLASPRHNRVLSPRLLGPATSSPEARPRNQLGREKNSLP